MGFKRIFKRGLSFAMAFSMAASVLVGCGNSKKKEESILQTQGTVSKENVYKTEKLSLDGVNFEGAQVKALNAIGDKIYLAAFYEDEKTQILSFNPDGSGLETVDIPVKKGEEFESISFLPDGGFYAYKTVRKGDEASGAADASGEAASEDASTSDASTDSASTEGSSDELISISDMIDLKNLDMYIEQYDNKGTLVESYDCASNTLEIPDFNIFNIVVTDDGNVFVSSSGGILGFSFDTGLKTVIDTLKSDSGYCGCYFRLCKGTDGKIFAYDYASNTNVYVLDTSKGELSEPIESLSKLNEFGTAFFAGSGYELYVSTNDAIYGYDENTNETTKLVDNLDSGLEVDSGINTIAGIGDKDMIAAIPGFDKIYELVKITKVPEDQVKEKKIITLGGIAIDWRVRDEAIKFNRENDEYQIKLIDYSNGANTIDGSSEEAVQKFDMDLVAGNVPDIMVFFSDQPYAKYQNKGLFYDYKPLFEKDEDMKNVKLLPNLQDAMTTDDGKMYTLITEFEIGTLLTNQKYVGDKQSLGYKDCDDIVSSMGAKYDMAFGAMDQSMALEYGIEYSGDKFIDLTNKKCSFDSDEFKQLLEYAGKFPAEIDYEKFGEDTYAFYGSGESLFMYDRFYGYGDYQIMKQAVFGNDISFIGNPNEAGTNDSVIIPCWRYAISAKSNYPEAAWDFIKRFWEEDFINRREFEYGFSVTEYGLNRAAENIANNPYRTKLGGKKEYYVDSYPINGSDIELKPLNKDEIDYVTDFVLSVDKVDDSNSEILNIISEEASAYFSGQKSADEVAKIIQNRVSIYVNESN
ncbi:carbohydrate ABC transporter substrate-binding protein [Butyrivibrio sp. X503]|uniref:ABC transporter substrate-binding protein n=1 Tax=Butyrivibrio sp. X503 TaxID=2364878 RepID=UPI000EA8D443|nr:ABC transporter substrate-binding protein [Butyrivibrio sp. X503]RKM57055.1 carbohydrate ABC transporter substrate-binding protein [Butyrivibrio sp. X503]